MSKGNTPVEELWLSLNDEFQPGRHIKAITRLHDKIPGFSTWGIDAGLKKIM